MTKILLLLNNTNVNTELLQRNVLRFDCNHVYLISENV
jgi:hypothetical protein